jgi:two-component system, LuxR family, response regulator FixJ
MARPEIALQQLVWDKSMSHKVYIVDDDDAVRTAMTLLLRSVQLDAAPFASAQTFLQHIGSITQSGERCCLVIDVRMPGMSGLELQDELRRRQVDLPLILISGHGDVPMAVRAIRMGAVSFLQKPVNEQELIDLINLSLNGHTSPEPDKGRTELQAKRALLSSRQCEIFDLLMQGLQTKEVAHRLQLSPRTIEVHRSHILERLGAQSFTQLVRDLLQRSIKD